MMKIAFSLLPTPNTLPPTPRFLWGLLVNPPRISERQRAYAHPKTSLLGTLLVCLKVLRFSLRPGVLA